VILSLFVSTLFAHQPAIGQTNLVTGGNGSNYTINNQADPQLTLQRGVLYVFQLSGIGGHPFYIKSALGSSSMGRYDTGVTNNGSTSGSLFFAVTTTTPTNLFYQCGAHFDMNGALKIIKPAAPTVRIVYLTVTNGIFMKSTGTNGWSVAPEFKCGLGAASWSAVANFTNTYAAGTNTTTFNRQDAICGSTNVFLRIRNQ